MPTVPQKPLAYYAEKYTVTTRTIQRWIAKDYPIDDEMALAEKLGIQKHAPEGHIPKTLAGMKERKLELEIEKLAIANAIARGEYTENAKVREDMTTIATTQRAAFMRLEDDLPGVLAGLDSAAIKKILRKKIDEIMGDLHDAFCNLYHPKSFPAEGQNRDK